MTTLLHLQLFGGFQLNHNQQSFSLANAPRLQSLLAYLALAPDVPHSRQQLAFLLWPDSPEKLARTSLRKLLHRLRQILPDIKEFITIDNHTVGWRADIVLKLDVADFEAALAEAANPGARPAERTHLEQAIKLYQGDLLPSCDGEWITLERERLFQRFIEALTRLTQILESQGDYTMAIHYAQYLIRHDPLREIAYQHLIHLYALTGNRAKALHTYQTWVDVLQQELDVAPDSAIRNLYERLLDVDSPSLHLHNLPAPPTEFIGRDQEVAAVVQKLTNPVCRLLTLVGTGGVGKTRLALQAGRQLIDDDAFTDGVFFVSLASIDPGRIDHLISAIIDALKLFFYSPEPPKIQLINHLREKEMLLILDNFEHLLLSPNLDTSASEPQPVLDFITELLQSAAKLKVMATSRVRLNLYGEWLFSIQGLDFPDRLPTENGFVSGNKPPEIEQYSAAQLLLQSTRRLNPGFVLTETEKPFLIRVCQLVEGLPLGLELAATWVGTLSFREIVTKMEQSLGFLTTSLHNVPDRHRSLYLSIEHSWQLLADEERQALRDLTIFRGGLWREAAEAVTAIPLPILSNLVHKSLLRRTASGRYELHELLRQYVAEQQPAPPDDLAALQSRYCDYYAAFIFERLVDLKGGPRQQQVSAEINEEIENIRLAWQWSLDQQRGEAIYQLVRALSLFYEWRGWGQEAALMLQQILEALPGMALPSPRKETILGYALSYQGFVLGREGRFEPAITALQQSLYLLQAAEPDHREVVGQSHFYLGIAALGQGDLAQARQQLEAGLALSRQAGDLWCAAGSLTYLGHVARGQGNLSQAKAYYQESITVSKKAGDRKGLALGLNNLGSISLESGDLQLAQHYCRESLTIFREIVDQPGLALVLDNLGLIALKLNDLPAATRYLRESLKIGTGIRLVPMILKTLVGLAHLLSQDQTKGQIAVELLLFVTRQPFADPVTQTKADQLLAELTSQLPPGLIMVAQVKNETHTLANIVKLALEHTS